MQSIHTSIQNVDLSDKINRLIEDVEMFDLIDFVHDRKIHKVGDVANLMVTDQLDLVKWINIHAPKLDVIFISTNNNAKHIQQVFRMGVFDLILVPFSMKRLKKSFVKYCEYKGYYEYHETLTQEEIDQVNLDRIAIKTMCVESTQNMTCSKIYKYMVEHTNTYFTSSEVAEALKISRITARKYMDCLESKKILEINLAYGDVGRPKNQYIFKGDESVY